jgi:hypothetical protein
MFSIQEVVVIGQCLLNMNILAQTPPLKVAHSCVRYPQDVDRSISSPQDVVFWKLSETFLRVCRHEI